MGALEQQIADALVDMALDLLRVDSATQAEVLRVLRRMEFELTTLLQRDNLSETTKERLRALLRQATETIDRFYMIASGANQVAIAGVAEVQAAHAGQVIAMIAGAQPVLPTPYMLARLVSNVLIEGAPSSAWWSKQSLDVGFRFQNEVRQGIAQGETNAQIVARIVGNDINAGVMEISRSNARALVHTSIQAVANASRLDSFKRNADIAEALVWLSTLDSHVCIACAARDLHQYALEDQEPLDGGPPWDAGPGALHWSALAEGSQITTARGLVPIESIAAGDRVLTHAGRWASVVARRAKRLQRGIVRVVHTQSGRILRAADDHPVLVTGDGWKFVGALEVGDHLFGDAKGLDEVARTGRMIGPEPKNGPALTDEAQVALKRTLQLVAPDIDFERDPCVWSGEVEHRATCLVLSDPTLIKDQSGLHHLLALAQALKQLGRHRLRDLLTLLVRHAAALESSSDSVAEAGALFGEQRARDDAVHLGRIFDQHTVGVGAIGSVRFFGESKRPMGVAHRVNGSTESFVEADLVDLRTHDHGIASSVCGKRAVRQAMAAFYAAQRVLTGHVFESDQLAESRIGFRHDRVVSLRAESYSGRLYDLEVEGDRSYVANGLIVSNCRCIVSIKPKPIPGIDELPEGERASSTGPVKGNTRFEEYLRRRGRAFADEVLGPGRAELYFDGKLTLEQLLDARALKPLTLEQLRAKYRHR